MATGGKLGLDFLSPIIRDAPRFLHPSEALMLEFGYTQADEVRDLAVATGAFAKPTILSDHQGIERAMVAVRK